MFGFNQGTVCSFALMLFAGFQLPAIASDANSTTYRVQILYESAQTGETEWQTEFETESKQAAELVHAIYDYAIAAGTLPVKQVIEEWCILGQCLGFPMDALIPIDARMLVQQPLYGPQTRSGPSQPQSGFHLAN